MKRFILSAVVLLAGLTSALADDYNLYILATDDAKTTFAASDIQKITFADGNVVVSTKTGQQSTTAISSVAQMYFNTETAEGISSTPIDANISINGNVITIGSAGRVSIYQVGGALVRSAQASSGTTLSLADLPAGIYIVNVDGRSLKFVKK